MYSDISSEKNDFCDEFLNQITKIYYTFKVYDIAFKCIPTYNYYKCLVTINIMGIKQVGSVFPCNTI